MTPGRALFDTPIGPCGIAWSERGVLALLLPGADAAATAAALRRRHPGLPEAAPPPPVQAAIAGIRALLQGEPADLRGVVLDEGGLPDFHRRVYAAARRLAPGQVATYGELAAQLGDPGAARAVGQALGRNPFALIVPCHRVLAAAGRPGGFSAPGGLLAKRRLLRIERAPGFDAPGLFDDG